MITKLITYILIRLYTHTFDKIQILKIIVWHCHQSSAERIGEQQYDKMIIEAIWQEYKNTNPTSIDFCIYMNGLLDKNAKIQ